MIVIGSRTARLIALVVLVAWPRVINAQDSAKQARYDRTIAQVVESHNKERAKEKLGPLKVEEHLVEAAKAHARDMADQELMTHDGSDGSHPAERVTRAGYHYLHTGENVAQGYRTVPEVMKGWMESPPHKKNILDDYTEIGVALVYGNDGKPYWCAEFGRPIPKFEPLTASTELARRINDERATAKKPLITVDPKLSKAAQEQATKLANAKSQGGGTATFDGIDQKAYPDVAVTTTAGHPDAEAMTKVLMDSAKHKEQILGKYARIGIGYATSEDGTPYWCLILANTKAPIESPRSSINNR